MNRRDVMQSGGALIQQSTYTWASVPGGTGYQSYHYPYIQQSVEKTFEVGGMYNGVQLTEVATTNDVDTYGTLISSTKVTTEMSSANGAQAGAQYTEQVLNSQILDNLTTWCLGGNRMDELAQPDRR